jgi:hypothetical protein
MAPYEGSCASRVTLSSDGDISRVPEMMRTYHIVFREIGEVLASAGTNSLFEARVFKDLCFVARAIAQGG